MTTPQRLRAEGNAQGVPEGVLQGQAAPLLVIKQARGLQVTDEVRAWVEACSDAETLQLWTGRALGAESLADVFASLLKSAGQRLAHAYPEGTESTLSGFLPREGRGRRIGPRIEVLKWRVRSER